jgi:Pyruvate/2-oxoglutarate dehydrogenase complex, dihydrolipoamide acyltransferase (E2) component, and related enzymes
VGEPIAITGNKDEDISALLNEVSSNGAKTVPPKIDDQPAPPTKVEKPAELQLEETSATTTTPTAPMVRAQPTTNGRSGRMLVSPIAARMAADNGIDLKTVAGSGPNGRIIKRDIETALSGTPRTAPNAADAGFRAVDSCRSIWFPR